MMVRLSTPPFISHPFQDPTPKHPSGAAVTNNSTRNMSTTDPFGAPSNNRATESYNPSNGAFLQRYDSTSTHGTNAAVYSSTPTDRTAETHTQFVVPQSATSSGFPPGTRAAEYSIKSDETVGPNREQLTQGEGVATQTPDGQLTANYTEQRQTRESNSQRVVGFGYTNAARNNDEIIVDKADYTNLQPNASGTVTQATEIRQVAYQSPGGNATRETEGQVAVTENSISRGAYTGVEQTQATNGQSTITDLEGNGSAGREEGERRIYNEHGEYIGRGVTIRRLDANGLPVYESGYIRYVDEQGNYNGRLDYTRNGEVIPRTPPATPSPTRPPEQVVASR